jgi:cytochrome P450
MSRHQTVDLAPIMLFYSMDAAMRIAFGEELGSLKSETDVGGTIQLIRDRFNHWGLWSSLPSLEMLVYRNPIAMRSKKAPSSMAAKAVSKFRARMSGADDRNIQIDLLGKFTKASIEFPDGLDMLGIISMLMSTISGAGDTTATTMTAVIYNVLQRPSTLSKLRTELHEAKVSKIPTFKQVQKLPYLNAVIRESMRMFSTPNWPMERKVPAGGATIAGVFFPEGTGVGCMPTAVHLDRKAFGQDADVFRPERWLEAGEESLGSMEAAHLGFSRGRRVCLGQNIAVMQIKKVIPALILGFDVCLIPTQYKLLLLTNTSR